MESPAPSISVITVTCGRVHWLESSVFAFLNQKYSGPHELIILNTFPKQTLSLPSSGKDVRVINLTERPENLGQARNRAILESKGSVIVILDDDDYALPHHLATFGDHFQKHPADDWAWMDTQFWGWGNTIKEIVRGQCPCFAFTKKAWEAVGGYPNLSVGEDRLFISKVTEKFSGSQIKMEGNPSFVYRWNNGAYHTSGQGDDKPGTVGAYERFMRDVERRVMQKVEPVGNVALEPKPDCPWEKLAVEHVGRELKKNELMDICVVELGRFGDIINILPVLQRIYERVGKPRLMVSREFASLLDGVSYVEPHVVDFPNSDLNQAVNLARKEYRNVIVTQIWGSNWNQERKEAAYNKESWRMSGFLSHFNDPAWRPYFDRRDPEAEKALADRCAAGGKQMLLINITKSVSSPFPQGQTIKDAIIRRFSGRFVIVDLSDFKLRRIYDLLGLMDRAVALVSIDTATLHLAAVTNIPVVALVNPTPWQGTIPRFNCVSRITYSEAVANPNSVLNGILRALEFKKEPLPVMALKEPPSTPPTLIHAVETHGVPDDRIRRAQESWNKLYAKGVVPAHLTEAEYPRNAANTIGDRRKLPYLKDVLLKARRMAKQPHDIIFFTNDDNYLHPATPERLTPHVLLYECACTQRVEFKGKPVPPDTLTPEQFVAAGDHHMGRDIFAFTVKWLDEHWNEIPDFILGASDWDLCMAAMIRLHFGIETTRQNLEDHIFPAELANGLVSHEAHASAWNHPLNTNSAPSQKHNRKLFRAWANHKLPRLVFHANDCI